MAANAIRDFQVVPLDGPDGPSVAMMISLDVGNPGTAQDFVADVADRFKLERMMAPPDTSVMLVTIIGDLSASEFSDHWLALQRSDPMLETFMHKMDLADVVQGTSDGQELSRASLLSE
jgi:hypothetical protein